MKLQIPLTDLFRESTGEWVERDLLVPGDEIELISVKDGCNNPGCCNPKIRFKIPDWPELGILSGEIAGVTAGDILRWE